MNKTGYKYFILWGQGYHLGYFETKEELAKLLESGEILIRDLDEYEIYSLDDTEKPCMVIRKTVKMRSKTGEWWARYYEPSASFEWTDGQHFYNHRGTRLRNPEEYNQRSEGYTPFGDE